MPGSYLVTATAVIVVLAVLLIINAALPLATVWLTAAVLHVVGRLGRGPRLHPRAQRGAVRGLREGSAR